MAENNDVPKIADKMLFAEDLINHVMNHAVETSYKRRRAERYRTFVHNAFNETIQEAVTFLYNKVDMESKNIFLDMLRKHSVNLSTYKAYAKNIREKYFTDGFDTSGFLHYCVYLSRMAVNFYKHEVVTAPDLAIEYIVDALNDVDMTTGGWATLNTVCEKFANTEDDILNELSPHSTSGEEAAPSGEQNMDESGASYPIMIRVGSSSYLKEDFKEYEVQIRKVSLEDHQARFNNNSSTENKEGLKKFNECYPPTSANSSKFGGKCTINGSSSGDTFAPGASNTTGISVLSVKGDYLDLPLNDINPESARNIPPPTGEKESSMLEITSKSKRHNSDSEENNYPNKKS